MADAAPPDPFAPLPTAAVIHPKTNKAEVWAPMLPAPQELPDPGLIKHREHGTASRTWTYRDGTGQPLFGVVRFDKTVGDDGQRGKELLPYSFGLREWTTKTGTRHSKTGWHFKRPAKPVPLYGLNRLAAKPDAPVLICEGEKAADAAAALFPHLVPMTSQGGSNAAANADWSVIAGREVIIWPDHDTAGLAYAEAVTVHAIGACARSVVTVTVPQDWPEGWDLADGLPDGVTPDLLLDLLEGAKAIDIDPPPENAEADETLDPDVTAQEIDRLSRLSSTEYAQQRKTAAQQLRIGVGELDKAVKAEKAARRQAAEAASRGREPPAPGETQWPLGFFPADDGLYADTGENGTRWLCSPIEVLGEGRDAANENWSLYLRWRDRDGRPHTWPMPKRMLMVQPGELEAALVDQGLHLDADGTSRGLLRQALNGVRSGDRVTLVSRPGWHAPGNGDSAFILLDGETIGTAAETLVLKAPPEGASQKMASAGTLAGWQTEIAAKAQGNPAAAFTICAALAGPLLEPLGESSGGFHLVGRSKTGKTLMVRLGLSVWGLPRKNGLLRDWRSTANALEGAAEECNDGFLTLDEIHQADPKEVIGAVYLLANESGKGRMNREAVNRVRRTWRTIVISTGEIDVAMVANKAGQKLPAGAEVRLPSIYLDGRDIWPDLHGAASPEALMADLQGALQRQYGTAIGPFLDRLTDARKNPDELEAVIEAGRERFYDSLPQGSDAQVRDVARRCALIATAGEMAIEWGILPWEEGAAIASAVTILDWWLNRRGGTGSVEESSHVRIVRAFLSEFGNSRFVALDRDNTGWVERFPERPIISRAGFRRRRGDDGAEEYLISPDAWNALCGKEQADPLEVAKTLKEAGHLFVEKNGHNLTRPERVPGLARTRFYVVLPSIFGGAAESDDDQVVAA